MADSFRIMYVSNLLFFETKHIDTQYTFICPFTSTLLSLINYVTFT